jgi:hypothetical protein
MRARPAWKSRINHWHTIDCTSEWVSEREENFNLKGIWREDNLWWYQRYINFSFLFNPIFSWIYCSAHRWRSNGVVIWSNKNILHMHAKVNGDDEEGKKTWNLSRGFVGCFCNKGTKIYENLLANWRWIFIHIRRG